MAQLLRYPVRYLLPATLVLFTALIGTLVFFNSQRMAMRQIERGAVEELRAELNHLQGIVRLLLRSGNLDDAKTTITSLSATPGLESLWFTDADGVVLASANPATIGQHWAEFEWSVDHTHIEELVRGTRTQANLAGNRRKLIGYAPICGTDQSPASRCGFLLTTRNLDTDIDAAVGGLRSEAIYNGITIVAAALALFWFLHGVFNRRIRRLVATAKQFASGDMSARARMQGEDELGTVGAAFDMLLDRIVEDQSTLAQNEARLRKFAEIAADTFWEMGPDLRFTYAAGSFMETMGVEPEFLLGKTRQQLHPQRPEDAEQWRSHFDNLAAHRAFADFTVTWNHPDGTVHTLQLSGKPRFDDRGTFQGYRGTGRDVTEQHTDITARKRAEQALRENHRTLEARVQERTAELARANQVLRMQMKERERAEARFRGLVESAPDAMVIVNEAGSIELVNARTEALFGYDRDELINQPIELLIPASLRVSHEAHRRQYTHAPQARAMGVGLELNALTKDGRELPVEISLSPLRGEAGMLVSAAIRDNSERRRQEHASRAAMEEAERANTAKSRFLAAASHDLRQPLQSLGIYLDVLLRKVGDGDATKIIDEMNRSLGTMGALLNALLDISKLDAKMVKPELATFPVQELLDRISTDASPQATDKGLAIRVMSSSAIVHTDPTLLEQIVKNFVFNAIRYTESGRVLLGCRHRGDKLRIEVWDSGIGIPHEALETIFEEFVQLDNDARDRKKGLGLGLAIANRTADLLGHTLDVKSTPGKGSVFGVEVPLGRMIVRAESVQPVTSAADDSSGATIFLVDDDPDIVQATGMLLELSGFQVVTADGAEAALRQIEQATFRPDLLVCDYRLPNGATGVELIKRIREDLKEDRIPAIICTGDTSPKRLKDTARIACEVLHKPMRGDVLISTIQRLLSDAAEPQQAVDQTRQSIH